MPTESRKSIGAASAVAIAGFGQPVGRTIRTESGAGQAPEPAAEKKVRRLLGITRFVCRYGIPDNPSSILSGETPGGVRSNTSACYRRWRPKE